jgi:hypothetical protein
MSPAKAIAEALEHMPEEFVEAVLGSLAKLLAGDTDSATKELERAATLQGMHASFEATAKAAKALRDR